MTHEEIARRNDVIWSGYVLRKTYTAGTSKGNLISILEEDLSRVILYSSPKISHINLRKLQRL